MTETGSSGTVRETLYEHDLARRLLEVGFDTDGDTDVDDVVGYAYDLGGRRTLLAMPGDRDVTYSYDARGQMRTLTDWDDQTSQFRYDAVGRHALTLRANGMRSLYRYDAGGRLRLLRHDAGARLFAQFGYEVDARGNRTEAFEAQRHPGSGTTVIDQSDDAVYYAGDWTTDSGFHVTEQPYASFRLTFAGNGDVELTMGEGPNHGLYDVYIGGSLWQSFNGYAASAGERVIPIPLSNDGPFTLQVNNRADKGSASSGHVMRFKQLSVDAEYTLQTIGYTYDAASRVLDVEYYPGENTASTPTQTFAYEYDIAGNLTDNNGTARTFNKLNQISSGGLTYDANGNMTSDGTNAYTWDRANRLLSMGGHAYAYDGMGSRTTQTVSSIVTNYLLDVQPNIVQVISATASSNTENYLHSPRGIHATQDTAENWRDILQDGLGSVRGEINDTLEVDASGAYRPYGIPTDVNGAYSQPFRFTGEMRDANALQYHRLRFYSSDNAVFLSYDPFEALKWVPGSMNAYSWVNGNVANLIDPSGKVGENPDDYDTCNSSSDNAFEGCFGIIRPTAQGRVADVFMTPRYESTKVTTIMNGSRVKIFGYTSPKRSYSGTDIDAAYEHQWVLIGSEDITSSTAIGWVPTYLITIENGCSLVQNIEQGNLPCAAGSASIFGCSDIAGQERVGYRLLNGFMARGGATARVGGCGRWKIAEGAQETFTGAEEQVLYGVPPGTSYLDLHCGEDMRAESNFRSVYATISGQYDSYLGEFGQHVITSGGQRFIFIHTTNPFNLQSGDQIQPGMYIGEYTEDLGYSTGPHLDITYSVPSSEYKLRYRYPLPFFNFEG